VSPLHFLSESQAITINDYMQSVVPSKHELLTRASMADIT